MATDTTNIYHADAFEILQEWPFCRIVKFFGSLRFTYAGQAVVVSAPSRPNGPADRELGRGLTVRTALQAAWGECIRRAGGDDGN